VICFGLTLDLFGAPPLLAEIDQSRLPSLWVSLLLGYLGVGAAMAWHLGRRGHQLGTSTMALACWPLLLGLVGREAPVGGVELDATHHVGGPNRGRIDACIAGLQHALDEQLAGAPLIDAAALLKLRGSLYRADHRIAQVDRLLGEARATALTEHARDVTLEAAIARLSEARNLAAHELEAVLAGLLSLRVQLGLFALAGESEPVRARFGELEARVAALAELSSIELAQVQS
jgi:hypothetical protein